MSVWSEILNFILPPRCISCGRVVSTQNGLCAECFSKIDFISSPYCQHCGRPLGIGTAEKGMLCPQCLKRQKQVFRMTRSAFKYNDNSKHLILAFKFYDKTENASVLAKMMFRAGHDIFAAGVDVIIPVPLHYTRLLKRKYNQSALLANELKKLSKIPVCTGELIKYRYTRPQVEFSGKERVKNVKAAFKVRHPERIKGKRIVLVDDVMTTGSTLKECALVLKQAGAETVDTLTVARVLF